VVGGWGVGLVALGVWLALVIGSLVGHGLCTCSSLSTLPSRSVFAVKLCPCGWHWRLGPVGLGSLGLVALRSVA